MTARVVSNLLPELISESRTRRRGARGRVSRDVANSPNTGPTLSSHDGFYELHGIDLTSDAE